MKKFLLFIFLSFIFIQVQPISAEVIRLNDVEKNTIKLTENKLKETKSLVLKDRDVVSDLIKMQKEEEVKDIELLWNATINNNTLIKFTMNKLNMPESQKRLHSSIMAKSLSSLRSSRHSIPR